MKRRRQRRRRVEAANFQRQAQALTILTIGTVIFGGALFQVDVSIDSLISNGQMAARVQITAVLITGLVYVSLVSGVSDILHQTAPVKGSDIANTVNLLLIEVAFAIVVFVIGTVVK